MRFSLSNRALLRGMMAGAVVLTGTACHRSDRTESGRDSSAAVLPDTSSTAAQPSGAGTTTRAVSDTATTSAQPSTPAPSNTPRAKTAAPSDKDAVGYRSMERDTTNVASQHSGSARVTADTADVSSASSDTSLSQTSSAADSAAIDASADVADSTSTEMAGAADTTAAGYSEMARDTSTVADQVDTAATANGEVALRTSIDTSSQADADASADAADTTGNAGRIRPPEDSTEILGEVRVRPPEDSTEILGNVTTDEAADETADEQVVRPEDRVTVAAAETPTDEVGAAAMGGNVTGEDAVALMTREGLRCAVVDPETNEAVRWDMSSTPVSLNPCGMGSMILSRIWTRVE
jgi:hypothetical protein